MSLLPDPNKSLWNFGNLLMGLLAAIFVAGLAKLVIMEVAKWWTAVADATRTFS
jgi:hypothetical protein